MSRSVQDGSPNAKNSPAPDGNSADTQDSSLRKGDVACEGAGHTVGPQDPEGSDGRKSHHLFLPP